MGSPPYLSEPQVGGGWGRREEGGDSTRSLPPPPLPHKEPEHSGIIAPASLGYPAKRHILVEKNKW